MPGGRQNKGDLNTKRNDTYMCVCVCADLHIETEREREDDVPDGLTPLD